MAKKKFPDQSISNTHSSMYELNDFKETGKLLAQGSSHFQCQTIPFKNVISFRS